MIETGGLDRRWKIAIAAAVALSVAGRLLALWIAGDRTPLGDPANYEIMARNLLGGRGLVIDDPLVMDDLRAFYPPGYPLLLAAVGVVLPLAAPVYALLNTAIDAAAALLIARLGERLGSKRAGMTAALLYFAWPTQLLLSPLAYKEGLVALLVLGQCLALLVAAGDRRRAAMFGLLTGLLVLVQPALVLLAPLLGLAVRSRFPSWSRWLKAMTFAAAVTVACLVPWWIRNWLVFGQFVPLTTSGPSGLWIGATPTGSGSWVQLPRRFLSGGELESARAFSAEAWRIIAADPIRYLIHCFAKIPTAFQGSAHPIGQLFTMQPPRHGRLLLGIGWIPGIATVAMLAAAGVGIVRRSLPDLNRLLLAAIAFIPLVAMWFEFSARHRYYLTPLLLLAAASAFAASPKAAATKAGAAH